MIIIGGGIGGLALGLTLHQIGVRCSIYESVRNLKPLGVGINLQPNAVRELYELGIGPEILDTVGLPVKEWALVGMQGQDIYSEPRGSFAGYNWPQYAVHRGEFHMALYHRFWMLWVLRHFIQGIVPKVTVFKKTAGQALRLKPQLTRLQKRRIW